MSREVAFASFPLVLSTSTKAGSQRLPNHRARELRYLWTGYAGNLRSETSFFGFLNHETLASGCR